LSDGLGGVLVESHMRGALRRRIHVTIGPQGAAGSHVPLLVAVALAVTELRDGDEVSVAV
jgi:hypothetical protein